MVWFYLIIWQKRLEFKIRTFNPTMVWFYLSILYDAGVLYVALSIPLWSDFIKIQNINEEYILCTFNPTMVWFYPCIVFNKDFPEMPSFNPTMVWFYPYPIFKKLTLCYVLSIPLWSDFIVGTETYVTAVGLPFQSHYGLILSSE